MDVVNAAASTTLFTIAMADPESSTGFCRWSLLFVHGGNQQTAAGTFTWAATNDGAASTPGINWALDTQELGAGALVVDNFLITFANPTLTVAINLATGSDLNAGPTDTQQITMIIEQGENRDITLG